jgi:hypothetical protein
MIPKPVSTLPAAFSRLEELHGRFSVLDQINPTNTAVFKEQFLSRNNLPFLNYSSLPVGFEETRKELNELEFIDSHPGNELYRLAQKAIFRELELIESAGSNNFAIRCLEQGTPPSESEVQAASNVLKTDQEKRKMQNKKPKKLVSTNFISESLQTALNDLGLTNWNVTSSSILSRCRVDGKRRVIELNNTAKFYEGDERKLAVHEIYGHVLRQVNGATQPLPILAYGLPDYLSTEEGITGHLERLWGLKPEGITGAKHVIAIHAALRGGFFDTFDAIRPFCLSDDLAYRLTLRSKRGLQDVSQPGAYLKDLAYWRGEQEIKVFLSAGGHFEDLFVGKIGIQHLDILVPLREQGWVNPPKWLPPIPIS